MFRHFNKNNNAREFWNIYSHVSIIEDLIKIKTRISWFSRNTIKTQLYSKNETIITQNHNMNQPNIFKIPYLLNHRINNQDPHR